MKNAILSSIALLLLGSAIWWMGANVVWLGDDLDYKYMMKGEIWQSWGYINCVGEFFKSQWIHYQNVNGRFVAHTLVQLFNSQLGQQTFAVCNAIVYILFALLIAKAGKVSFSRNSGGILSAICLSVLCFITKMMPTCQIGYIWGMTSNIAWLIVFFRKGRPSWWLTVGMLLMGLFVGNWQESVSIGVCAGVGIWWLIQFCESIRKSWVRFDWRRSWMLLGFVVGTASNCLAPSTMGRVSDIAVPFTDQLLIGLYSFPAVIALILCIIIGLLCKHEQLRLFSFDYKYGGIPKGVLFTGMLMLIAFNLAIGIYSNRQLFGANLFSAILALSILPRHRFNAAVNTLASVIVAALWLLQAQGIMEVHRQYDDIARLHSESADGSVVYDRTRVLTLGFPLSAKYYEDILGQFDNDLHHSLMKDFKHTRKGKTLKLKPTASLDREKAESYAPGHFTVILKEPPKGEATRKIKVYGHYPLFGIKAQPRTIQVIRYSNRSKAFGAAVIIPEFPFFIADSIHIIEN